MMIAIINVENKATLRKMMIMMPRNAMQRIAKKQCNEIGCIALHGKERQCTTNNDDLSPCRVGPTVASQLPRGEGEKEETTDTFS